MTRTRRKAKGRSNTGTFTQIPHAVQDSDNFRRLSFKAVKLLIDIARHYNGHNNGDLAVAFSIMQKRGRRSTATLSEALKELLHYGMLTLTRQGGKNRPSLYALTWHPIDDCRGKHDVATTEVSPGFWKQASPDYVPRRVEREKSLVRKPSQFASKLESKPPRDDQLEEELLQYSK